MMNQFPAASALFNAIKKQLDKSLLQQQAFFKLAFNVILAEDPKYKNLYI